MDMGWTAPARGDSELHAGESPNYASILVLCAFLSVGLLWYAQPVPTPHAPTDGKIMEGWVNHICGDGTGQGTEWGRALEVGADRSDRTKVDLARCRARPGPRMRKVVIEIECENDAFEPHPEVEVASMLRDLSDRLLSTSDIRESSPKLYDSDGNHVGTIRLVAWHR